MLVRKHHKHILKIDRLLGRQTQLFEQRIAGIQMEAKTYNSLFWMETADFVQTVKQIYQLQDKTNFSRFLQSEDKASHGYHLYHTCMTSFAEPCSTLYGVCELNHWVELYPDYQGLRVYSTILLKAC